MNANTSTFTDDEGNAIMWYGASSLSPASDDFAEVVSARIDEIRAAHPEKDDEPIPSDLVTCSGSGFDSHISPAAAEYQVERLSKNTGKSEGDTRGKLNIFFGYVAGAGKTYAMLEEAHDVLEKGFDVAVGYIEPHTRADTMALVEDLEQLPLKEVEHRGIKLREFDLDGAL